jgi:DNA-binding response OmpR family regulator
VNELIERDVDEPGRPLIGVRLLLVEDDLLVAMELEEIMSRLGAQVIGPFSCIADALDALRREVVTGAVLDIQLDGETTLCVADVLLKRGDPILFVTGTAPEAIPQRYRDLPRVTKPFDLTEFESSAISIFGRQ